MCDKISVTPKIEQNTINRYYYLYIRVDYKEYYNTFIIQRDIINFLNIPRDYWYNELSKFNYILKKETIVVSFDRSYSEDQIYFENIEDCENAKKWFEDNLDYFLILKKLGDK